MPVMERKTLIMRHNKMQEGGDENEGKTPNTSEMSGVDMNNFVANNMGIF